jgi:hypothetical protein
MLRRPGPGKTIGESPLSAVLRGCAATLAAGISMVPSSDLEITPPTAVNLGSPNQAISRLSDLDGTGVTTKCLGPWRSDQHSGDLRSGGFRSSQPDPAGGHGAASPLARLGCRRESDGSTISRSPLGSRATAPTSGREGWGTGGIDQHRDDANHAQPVLARSAVRPGLMNQGKAWSSHTGEMPLAAMSAIWGGVCERYPDFASAFSRIGRRLDSAVARPYGPAFR